MMETIPTTIVHVLTSQVLILQHLLVTTITVNLVIQDLMIYLHIIVEMCYGMENSVMALTITVVLVLICRGSFNSWLDL